MFTALVDSGLIRRFIRCSSGAVAPMVALMLVPILGATALAVDVSYWYQKQRSMQNAADSAAIAAAQTGDADYVGMAKGTAARYGYVDGAGSVTVVPSRVTCPSGTGTCTQVVIGYTSPLFFAPVVGFQGNKNGGAGQGISALAVAGSTSGTSHQFCILTLDKTAGANGLLANGVPKADVGGCDIFSNNDLTCHGGNLNAGSAIAVGTSSVCGGAQISGAPPVPDPYGKDGNKTAPTLPSKSDVDTACGGSYPQIATSGQNKGNPPSGNQIVGTYNWSTQSNSTKILCGDIQLTGDVTLQGSSTVVIENGWLDLNGHTLKTGTGADATIVFSGSDGYKHYPTSSVNNSGTIDIKAPSSGNWKGFALYQDPSLKSIVDVSEAGNAPAYNITGIIYMPNAVVTVKGIINKSGTGYNCNLFIVKNMIIDGTGEIFKPGSLSECAQAGVDIPSDGSGTAVHKWLVK